MLDSAPGGAPLAPLADGSTAPAPGTIGTPKTASSPTPTVRVLASSATSAKLEVQGASGPVWLVLGESLNTGWQATGPGGRSLGEPQLIDGYANGWYAVPPRSGRFIVTLEFGPQRIVTPAILISGATLAVCLLVGFVPFGPIRRRTRRRRAHAADGRAVGQAGDLQRQIGNGSPTLGSPFAPSKRRPTLPTCIIVAAACGAVAMLVLPPPWAPSIAGATTVAVIAALCWPRARSLLSVAAVGCIAAAGAVTVLDQVRHHYQPGSAWPHNLEAAGVLAFIAVVALATDTAVEVARQHRGPAKHGNGPQAS